MNTIAVLFIQTQLQLSVGRKQLQGLYDLVVRTGSSLDRRAERVAAATDPLTCWIMPARERSYG